MSPELRRGIAVERDLRARSCGEAKWRSEVALHLLLLLRITSSAAWIRINFTLPRSRRDYGCRSKRHAPPTEIVQELAEAAHFLRAHGLGELGIEAAVERSADNGEPIVISGGNALRG
jgi:hypothetical protein